MGKVLNNRSLMTKELLRLSSPVVLCVDRPDFDSAIVNNGYQAINLNLPLARSLEGLELREIRSVITDKIRDCLPQRHPIYLTEYEMLFDPRYELDIFRLFIDIVRRNKLIVKWVGEASDDTLIYAKQGYADFKQYKINDYDIVVVK